MKTTKSDFWDKECRGGSPYFNDEGLISSFLEDRLTGRNLDLGGGASVYYEDSVVVDFSQKSLKHCELPRERKVLFDLESIARGKKLPFDAHCFDSATLISVWQYLRNPISILRELERVLVKRAEVYVINLQGMGFEDMFKSTSYSTEIVSQVAKAGYDSFVEILGTPGIYTEPDLIQSVCVAMPNNPGEYPTKIKNKRARLAFERQRRMFQLEPVR